MEYDRISDLRDPARRDHGGGADDLERDAMTIRKIALMHKMFGTADGKCGDCKHLVQGRYHDLNIKKCAIYGLTHSEASDWAKRWQACGCFNRDVPNRNVIRLVRSTAEKEHIQVEGQEGFWEAL